MIQQFGDVISFNIKITELNINSYKNLPFEERTVKIKWDIINDNKYFDIEELEAITIYSINHLNNIYFNVIIICERESLKQLINQKYIAINKSICKYYEYINIIKCKNCWRYGHTRNRCYHNKTCINCSQPHNTMNYYNSSKCSNCIRHNKFNNITF